MAEKDHAFTAIELMLVVAPLGVVAAMAVPSVVNRRPRLPIAQ
jgi:prepilin-type N-terminal cleavage/methylation domain-containing protein